QRSTPFSTKEQSRTALMNFSGFTRRDSTPASCSKRMPNGRRPRPFTSSLPPPVEREPTKRAKGSIAFASNIFCDKNDARLCLVFFLLLALKRLTLGL